MHTVPLENFNYKFSIFDMFLTSFYDVDIMILIWTRHFISLLLDGELIYACTCMHTQTQTYTLAHTLYFSLVQL